MRSAAGLFASLVFCKVAVEDDHRAAYDVAAFTVAPSGATGCQSPSCLCTRYPPACIRTVPASAIGWAGSLLYSSGLRSSFLEDPERSLSLPSKVIFSASRTCQDVPPDLSTTTNCAALAAITAQPSVKPKTPTRTADVVIRLQPSLAGAKESALAP